MSLHWDWETRGVVNLLTRGVYLYADDIHTDAVLAAYRLGANSTGSAVDAWIVAGGELGKMYSWFRKEPCPPHVAAYVQAGGMITAHNAAFERLIWWKIMSDRHGWPKPAYEQWRCTAATAAAMSLPRSLDRLSDALNLTNKKSKRGRQLIQLLSLPQGFKDGEPIWNEDPALMVEFMDYCIGDVEAEEEADNRIVPFSDAEQAVYVLNEKINDRGVRIDVESAVAALKLVDKAKIKINNELAHVTSQNVLYVTQTVALKNWVLSQGVVIPSTDKDDIDDFLHDVDDLPDNVRRALELRQEGGKSSVSKISAMLDRVSKDGRVRGSYLHHGAGQSGRFSSRGLQAHNLPKYRKEFEALFEKGKLDLGLLFQTIRTSDPDMLELVYGPSLGRPIHLISDAIRSFLWAEPGHEFINADYTSIESVKAAWFAGEDWKLQAFSDLFAGHGKGIYELAAAGIYGVDVDKVTKPQRAVGKVAELSCQYATGVGGISRFARAAKVKLNTLYDALWENSDTKRQEAAEKRYYERLEANDRSAQTLGREAWISAELIKLGWRAKHPAITGAWKELDEAAKMAVEVPGQKVKCLNGRITYIVRHGFLWCRLPSGRCLAYGAPRMDDVDAPWADVTVEPQAREKIISITYRGVGLDEKWNRFSLYGGAQFNHICQGSAADVLRIGMLNAEAAGYPIVLHTHDEVMAELPVGEGSFEELEKLLCKLPPCFDGLPVKAAGWADKRYHK